MEITEEVVNGETYTITTHDSGHVVRELKMTASQTAALISARDRIMSVKQFLTTRFTPQELAALNTFCKTDALAESYKEILLASQRQEVVLDDPVLSGAIDYYIARGVIAAERKADILA